MDFITEVTEFIQNIYTSFVSGLTNSIDTLQFTYDKLIEFDSRMISALDSNFTTEIGSFPVVNSVSLFRWLVGDVAFYMIYLVIMFGCLMTIYRLAKILYTFINSAINSITSGGGLKSITGFLRSLLIGH